MVSLYYSRTKKPPKIPMILKWWGRDWIDEGWGRDWIEEEGIELMRKGLNWWGWNWTDEAEIDLVRQRSIWCYYLVSIVTVYSASFSQELHLNYDSGNEFTISGVAVIQGVGVEITWCWIQRLPISAAQVCTQDTSTTLLQMMTVDVPSMNTPGCHLGFLLFRWAEAGFCSSSCVLNAMIWKSEVPIGNYLKIWLWVNALHKDEWVTDSAAETQLCVIPYVNSLHHMRKLWFLIWNCY